MSRITAQGVVPLSLILLMACSTSEVPPSHVSEGAHAVALTAFQDVFERGISDHDTSALLRGVAPLLTLHVRGQSFSTRRFALLQLVQPIVTAVPDIRFHIEDVVAEGDRAAARLTFTGTNTGAWHGMGPTGRKVTISETFLCKLDHGRLRECWQEWDEAALRDQLSAH